MDVTVLPFITVISPFGDVFTLSESGEITLLDRSVKFVDDDDVGGGADGPVMIDDNVDVKRR